MGSTVRSSETTNSSDARSDREPSWLVRLPWLFTFGAIASTIAIERFEGRRWWCACGHPWIWVTDVWSEHCSQHLLDPYSFSHVGHGLVFCGILALAAPKWPVAWRFFASIAAASLWEVVENSSYVIERYRSATMSLNYLGDSIANSLGDIASCGLGFVLARQLGWKWSIALFVAMELVLLIWIRDNLTLNVIMLIHPVPAIKHWQTAGHIPS